MVPRQLELRHLKALSTRISAAISLEALPLPQDEASKSKHISMLARIRNSADSLQDETSGRLDHSLHRLSAELEKEAIDGETPGLQELRERRDALVGDLKARNCLECAKSDDRVCFGDDDHDRETICNGGVCIWPLRELISILEIQSRKLYSDESFTSPILEFSTTVAQQHADQGILNHFNITGFSQVVRGSVAKSIIGLEIRERAFDWEALCGTPYVFAHEIICHGFQGLDGGERVNAEEKCSWTEGWMDRFAFRCLIEWLNDGRINFPDWLKRDTGRVVEVASEIHRQRYEGTGSLTATYIDRRRGARLSFDQLWQAWGRNVPVEAHKATRFSVRLNGRTVPNTTREQIMLLLGGLGRSSHRVRFELAVGRCAEFVEHGNPDLLLMQLQDACARPLPA